jgi:hypothetical protein
VTTIVTTEDGMSVLVSESVRTIVANGVGIQGPPGTGIETLAPLLVNVTWGTPTAESGNAIEVTATITDANGDALSTSFLDVEILVSDGAADNEPSATATLSAGASPVGTVLAGSGTATLVIRSASGSFKVRVSESAAGYRYLWLRGAGHCRLWPRSTTGVLEMIFT